MTLIYILGFVVIAYLSLRSISKNLKRSANTYEYTRTEIKTIDNYDYCALGSRK